MTPSPSGTPDREGRRALFSPAPAGGARNGSRSSRTRRSTADGPRRTTTDRDGSEGRQAPFPEWPRRAGTVVIECSSCQGRTPVHVLDLWRHVTPSLWLPLRAFPVWMRCPACGRRTWCDLDWDDLLPR